MKQILEEWKKFTEPKKTRREEKEEVFPGWEDLERFSKGVVSEEDGDEKVVISKRALDRLIDEAINEMVKEAMVLEENPSGMAIEARCEKFGFHSLKKLLILINQLNSAEKGNLNKR